MGGFDTSIAILSRCVDSRRECVGVEEKVDLTVFRLSLQERSLLVALAVGGPGSFFDHLKLFLEQWQDEAKAFLVRARVVATDQSRIIGIAEKPQQWA